MAVRATEVPNRAPEQSPDAEEPFYGWRYLRRKAANGRYEYVPVPLTYGDLLNPQEGDQVIHSSKHQRILHYLRNVLEGQVRHDPTALILDDVLIDWGIPGLRKHGPDIAVFFGVRERKNWTTFSVVAEGVRPTIICEIASPDTARHDRTTKVREYHRAGVPFYILIDYVRQRRQERLILAGYRWTPEGYEPLEPNAEGRLWLGPVRLWLGIVDNELVCYDESGQAIDDYAAQVSRVIAAERQATVAERRAEAETQAREAAEERLRQLEAELRRLRGGE